MSESDKAPTPAQPAVPSSHPAAKATPVVALLAGARVQQGVPTPGLSQSIGLQELPGSRVPGLPGGAVVSHVFGPGQTPCDPIAAGLDLAYSPLTAAENRVISQTGAFAGGPRPTADAAAGGEPAHQAAPQDFVNIAAPSDAAAVGSPGPNSAVAGATVVKVPAA